MCEPFIRNYPLQLPTPKITLSDLFNRNGTLHVGTASIKPTELHREKIRHGTLSVIATLLIRRKPERKKMELRAQGKLVVGSFPYT